MQNRANILCTTHVDKQLVQKAAAQGIAIDVLPFIEIEPVVNEHLSKEINSLYTQVLNVVFTSVNAIPTPLPPHGGIRWNIFCISNATEKAATEKFGNAAIAGIANSAGELAELILKDHAIKEVIFFCGDSRRDDLPIKLREGHVNVREIIVYRTIATPKKVAKHYDGILFLSPSAVNSFFSANTIELSTTLFAIGTTTANAIKKLSGNKVIINDQPGKEQLINIMLAHYGEITMKNY